MILALVAATVAGCSGGGDAGPESTNGSSPSAPLVTTVPDTAPTTAATTASAAVADPDAAESATRSVEHAMGTTDVPADPQRVVVLDSSFLDAAISLGITPVAATAAVADAGVPSYLADQLPDIVTVGLTDTPNLEAIAAARPDLILGSKVRHEAIYDELSGIAPTVFSESSGTNWRDGFTLAAIALGRTSEGEQQLAAFDQRASAVGAAVSADDMTATIVRFVPDEIRLYGPDTFSGSVLTAAGFDLGDQGYEDNEFSMVFLSLEQLGRADADVIFSTSYGDLSGTPYEAAEALWKKIPAVADGRQFTVLDDEWMLGIGLIGANIILDDIEEALLP